MKKEFQAELTNLLNRHSIDTEMDTPDYILAAMHLRSVANRRAGPGKKAEMVRNSKRSADYRGDGHRIGVQT